MATDSLSKLKTYTARDLIEMDLRPREVVIDPWLRTEETAVIWAAAGVGKTMLSLSLALAVAGGGKLADWEAPLARKIIYIDGEMNIHDIRDRLMALSDQGAVALPDKYKALDNITIIARQAQDVGTRFYDLTDEETQTELLKLAEGSGAGLVILDNFTTLTDELADENDATQFKRVQDFFLQMKRAGIATILVHHANKSGRDMRGSTALATTFEVILGLKKPSLSRPGEASFVTEFGKFRGLGDGRLGSRTWTLKPEGWEVEDGQPEDPQQDPILIALKSCDYASQNEITAKLGVDKSTVSRRIKKLEAMGILNDGEATSFMDRARKYRGSDHAGAWCPDGEDLEGVLVEAF